MMGEKYILASLCVALIVVIPVALLFFFIERSERRKADATIRGFEERLRVFGREEVEYLRRENEAVNRALRVRAGLEAGPEEKAPAVGAGRPTPPEAEIDFSIPTAPGIAIIDGTPKGAVVDPYANMGDNAFPTLGAGDEAAFSGAREGFAALDEANAEG